MIGKTQTFEQFLATQKVSISIVEFLVGFLLTIVLSSLLAFVYRRYARSFSDRKSFSENFVMLSVTTMFVITVVKASLALSLGLVGALSIVRFRSAIKEPEELLYLFTCIAIGLGLGAGQIAITTIAVLVTVMVIVVRSKFGSKQKQVGGFYLTLSSPNSMDSKMDELLNLLKKNCTFVELKRMDSRESFNETTFLIEADHYEHVTTLKKQITTFMPEAQMSWISSRGLST